MSKSEENLEKQSTSPNAADGKPAPGALDSPGSTPARNAPDLLKSSAGKFSIEELSPADLKSVEAFAAHRETAVLAIMFTDLEGFTSLTERIGDARAVEILHEYSKHIKDIVERDGRGRQIKTIGDGTLAIFSEPSAAVERAIEIQESIRQLNQSRKPGEVLPVRIGLHMGQVTVEGGVERDIIGNHVNRAARIESLARGGQIFLSQTVYENARGFAHAPGNRQVAWKSHGFYQVRGIEEPVEIFEVGIEGQVKFEAPRPGPNCKLARNAGMTRAQQIRLIALTALLVAGCMFVMSASIRFRTVRRQNQKAEQIVNILHESDLRIGPNIEQQKKMMPELAYEEGNAALEYIRIPSLRISGKTSTLLQETLGEPIAENKTGELDKMQRLAGWLVESKVFSRLSVANNRMLQGGGEDMTKPIVSAENLKAAPEPPPIDCKSLESLEAGANKLDCAFYPEIFATPRDVLSIPVFDIEVIALIHRSQMARALIIERGGDWHKGALSLIKLLRFNYHLSQTVNSYTELSYLVDARRLVLLSIVDLYKRHDQMNQAANWSFILSSQNTQARQLDEAHAALFDEGYKQAHLGAKAAFVLLDKCKEDFWKAQAALCIGLTKSQKWNYLDRAECNKALLDAQKNEANNPRLKGLLKLFSDIPPGEFPPDLSFMKAVQ